MKATDRAQLLLSASIKSLLVVAFGFALFEGDWTTAFVSAIALITTLLPWYLARNYNFYIPVGFEFVIVLFVYSTLFLGEVHGFYTRFWWWDIVLHTGSGLAFGFTGFLILYSFYRTEKFQAPAALIALFSFCVAVAIGGLWEIFEFAMDSFLGLNMQKSGLVDTMWDMIVNTLGAFLASFSGYLYLRRRTRGLGIFQYYLRSYFDNERKGGA